MEEDNTKLILEASYQPQREAEATLAKRGYKYDTDLSTMENKVFYNPETNKPYIAYRGSVRVSDWLGNAKLALGLNDAEAEKRIQLAEKVKSKYGQSADIYGHSRGGFLAEQAGERYGGKVITYNKAALPSDVFKPIRKEQTDIRTSPDIVSAFSIFQKGGQKKTIKAPVNTKTIFSSALEAHSLKSLNA
jgi:hypothetical protein